MSYTEKYFKYKNKYLKLKNQIGGFKGNCSMCGILTNDLKQCGNCKKVSYCSIKCQKDDWVKHKQVCKKKIKSIENIISIPKIKSSENIISIRNNIFKKYKNKNTEVIKIGNDNFGDSVKNIMKFINKPYIFRNHNGIYYSNDYVEIYNYDDTDFEKLNGVVNDNFFEITFDCIFKSKIFILPSDALNSFINGPTFADCGNIIQICVYKYIYDLVGKDIFNNLFGKITNQLLVTPFLFFQLETKNNTDEYSKIKNPKDPSGNPLFFLFDPILDFDNLKHGDIVHIQGVKQFSNKHLVGFSQGWNLFCIKDEGINKFIGFGSTFFQEPLTYEEIKIILIDEYNKDQSNGTKERIRYFAEKREKELKSTPDPNYILIDIVKSNENHKIPINSDIGGFVAGIRLNKDKLNSFLQNKNYSWTSSDINYDEQVSSLQSIEITDNKFLIPFTKETENKTFENYIQDTPEKIELYNNAFKFAQSVSLMGINTEGPMGLLLSGTVGIGKSHLSVSIGKYVNKYGKKILFLDETFILLQTQIKQDHRSDFSETFIDIDLIIFDDTNKTLTSSNFLKQALKYIFDNKKAIIISSNNDIKSFVLYLPYFINYNDPISNNFKYLRNLTMESFRRPWTDTIIGKTLNYLFKYSGYSASAIIIEENEKNFLNLKKYSNILVSMFSNDKLPTIRYVEEPMKIQNEPGPTVYDLYVLDACKFDYCFINVYDNNDIEQLVNLINLIHNCGKKIVIITKSIEFLTKQINIYFSFSNAYKNNVIETNYRLITRINMILPGINITS